MTDIVSPIFLPSSLSQPYSASDKFSSQLCRTFLFHIFCFLTMDNARALWPGVNEKFSKHSFWHFATPQLLPASSHSHFSWKFLLNERNTYRTHKYPYKNVRALSHQIVLSSFFLFWYIPLFYSIRWERRISATLDALCRHLSPLSHRARALCR